MKSLRFSSIPLMLLIMAASALVAGANTDGSRGGRNPYAEYGVAERRTRD